MTRIGIAGAGSQRSGRRVWLLSLLAGAGACSASPEVATPDGAIDGAGNCPVMHGSAAADKGGAKSARTNDDWWPNRLDLSILHQNPPAGNPMGAGFDYAAEFAKLDLATVKKELAALLTTSQEWCRPTTAPTAG